MNTIRRAFTVIESLIAVGVLAASVIAVVGVVSASRQQQTIIETSTQAQTLAQQLLEEVLVLPFADPDGPGGPGPEAGENSRALFDNLDDYHGYSDSTSGLTQRDGTAVESGGGDVTYARSVSVEYRATVEGAAVSRGDFVVVTVSVADSRGNRARVSQLVTSVPLKR